MSQQAQHMDCDCETTVHHKLNRESVQLQIVSVLGRIWGRPANEASKLFLLAALLEYAQAAEEAGRPDATGCPHLFLAILHLFSTVFPLFWGERIPALAV
jgi:hypothetical protein